MSFRQSLLAAAEEAVKADEINRRQLFTLRVLTLRPEKLAAIQQACEEEIVSRELGMAGGAIDWSNLLALLRELLPILLLFFQDD